MKSRIVVESKSKWVARLAVAFLAAGLIAEGGQVQNPPIGVQPPPRTLENLEVRPPTQPVTVDLPPISTPLTIKQKDAIVKSNFKTTQRDVDKLSKLVQLLNTEMKKTNPDVLSVSIVRQANKIEKLAKKIKNEAKAY